MRRNPFGGDGRALLAWMREFHPAEDCGDPPWVEWREREARAAALRRPLAERGPMVRLALALAKGNAAEAVRVALALDADTGTLGRILPGEGERGAGA